LIEYHTLHLTYDHTRLAAALTGMTFIDQKIKMITKSSDMLITLPFNGLQDLENHTYTDWSGKNG